MLKDDGILAFTTFDMNTIYPKIKNIIIIGLFHIIYSISQKKFEKILFEKNLKIIKTINDPRFVSFEYLLRN